MNKKIFVIYTVTQTYCAFLNEEDVINTNGVVDDEYIEDEINQMIRNGEISTRAASSQIIWDYVNGTEN